jgi:hypothetical protein
VSYGEVLGDKSTTYIRGDLILRVPDCNYFIWCVSCTGVVLTGFVMRGCAYVWVWVCGGFVMCGCVYVGVL